MICCYAEKRAIWKYRDTPPAMSGPGGPRSGKSINGVLRRIIGQAHTACRQCRLEVGHEPLQPRLVRGLGAGDQHVLGVRGAQQPPAVGGADAHAVGGVDLGAVGLQARRTSSIDRELALSSTWKRSSGVLTGCGHRVRAARSATLPADLADDVDQPHRGVERVVEAVVAVAKKMWPLISPASGAPVSFILALIRQWPVFHISGLPPSCGDAVEQRLAGLDVGDDRRPGHARSARRAARIIRSWSPQMHPALAVDRADPVAVAVEGDAEIEPLLCDQRASGRRDSSASVGSG